MTEEGKKKEWTLADLEDFGEHGEVLEKFFPRGFYYDKSDKMLMDDRKIVAVYPAQEIPEHIKEVYKIRKTYPLDHVKMLMGLFKKGEKMTFHFPEGDYPMMIESERFIAFVAPMVDEKYFDDDEED